jgi:hypothetical protein
MKFYAEEFHLNEQIVPNFDLNQIKAMKILNECLHVFYANLSSNSLNIYGEEKYFGQELTKQLKLRIYSNV